MNFNTYIQEFSHLLDYKNGIELSELLTYQHKEHSQSSRLLNGYSEETIATRLNAPWNDICTYHLNACHYIDQSNFIAAYKEQACSLQVFTKSLQSMPNENWMCPVLNVLIRDLRLLAIAADLETSLFKNDPKRKVLKPHNYLENAAESIMSLFRITVTDLRSAEQSKRKSMINVINQLFKIYFKINKLHLCKPLVRALENQQNSKNTKLNFCMAERVTYNYFQGMRYMFDSDYRNADELLSFAFRNCHPGSYKNKRLILIFLIPVKMLLGIMPSVDLLRQYELMQFVDVVNAVKRGDLRLLDRELERHSEFFWKYGIYLILEKLKIIAYRNVFKNVILITKTHQVPITQFQRALNYLQNEETTIEEVHCILANLISDNKIKGYISLQHQKLVVSKQNPFPKLCTTV